MSRGNYKNSTKRRNMRTLIAASDGWGCHYCGLLLSHETATIDHKVALANGGEWSPANLLLSCRPCNLSKGTMSYRFFKGRCGYEALV